MIKTAVSVILGSLIFSVVSFSLATNSSAQIPDPYVKCPEVDDPEWHSLRPYQASPCKIPIQDNEQALLCGNDLIVRDSFSVPQPLPITCNGKPFPPPPCCNCVADCHFEVPRNFWVSIDAYESELPISGNTEEIEPSESYDNPTVLSWLKNLAREDKRLQPQDGDEGFSSHPPPDISDPMYYNNFQQYYIDYNTWRGKWCGQVTIPLVNITLLLCGQNPFSPDFWSNLYPYIPYTSTEDRIGKLQAEERLKVLQTDIDQIIPNPPNTNWLAKPRDERNANTLDRESVLYFAHMEENVESTSLLQSTYLPQDLLEAPQPIGQTTPPEIQNFCKIVDVRSNPGDQLFGERMADNTGVPQANVNYTASFNCPCTFVQVGFWCYLASCCSKYAIFNSKILTFTPMVDELWSKTVAGNASVFKKLFPQIEDPQAPITELKDIPAETDVTHSAKNLGPYPAVVTALSANSKLYFPHLGGIYDYFLKAIQTAIRPYGFEGEDLNLQQDVRIAKADALNEYISWYLQGTEYRAEYDFPDVNDEDIGDDNDLRRIVSFTGPLNRLLSQNSQWRNEFQINSVSYGTGIFKLGRTVQTLEQDKAKSTRHNQIVACTAEVNILGVKLFGIPMPCDSAYLDQVPPPNATGGPTPPGGTCPNVPDSAIDPKYLGAMKDNFKRMAATYGGCDLVDECYNYVVDEAEKAGVNPALTLTLWLHESGASSYCTNPGVKDFGWDAGPSQDVVAQLGYWLQIGAASAACNWCYSQGGWSEPMQAFLYNYRYGDCNPSGDQSFYDNMKTMFQWVSDPIGYCLDPGGSGFAINCPNDNSCP